MKRICFTVLILFLSFDSTVHGCRLSDTDQITDYPCAFRKDPDYHVGHLDLAADMPPYFMHYDEISKHFDVPVSFIFFTAAE